QRRGFRLRGGQRARHLHHGLISEPGEDRRQQLRSLGDEKKDREHRDQDLERRDPIAPAFAQETKHVVCCQLMTGAPYAFATAISSGKSSTISWPVSVT